MKNRLLKEFTTFQLMEEVTDRLRDAESSEIMNWCDDCAHFKPKDDASDKYNPCLKKHALQFHAPLDMGEVSEGNYGFYRLVCLDRVDSR